MIDIQELEDEVDLDETDEGTIHLSHEVRSLIESDRRCHVVHVMFKREVETKPSKALIPWTPPLLPVIETVDSEEEDQETYLTSKLRRKKTSDGMTVMSGVVIQEIEMNGIQIEEDRTIPSPIIFEDEEMEQDI